MVEPRTPALTTVAMLLALRALEFQASCPHCRKLLHWLHQPYKVTIFLTDHHRTETNITGNAVDLEGLQIRMWRKP